jgi:hypothetical protein
LEQSYRSEATKAEVLAANGVRYEIDFSCMQQFNSENRFYRREVRRRGPKLKQGAKVLSAVVIEDR